ncbi:hypothetical protein ACWDFL_16070 [Streptomyces bungoensis]
MDIAALITWVVTALGGFYMLGTWIRRGGIRQQQTGASRLPVPVVFGHFALAAIGLVVWIVYVVCDKTALAWTAFGILLPVAPLGFVVLAHWIPVHRERATAGAPPAASAPGAEGTVPAERSWWYTGCSPWPPWSWPWSWSCSPPWASGAADMTEHPVRTTARTDLLHEGAGAPARPALRVVHEPEGIDLAAAEAAAARFLEALGISTASESLRGTPGRMARAYAEMFSPRPCRRGQGTRPRLLARRVPAPGDQRLNATVRREAGCGPNSAVRTVARVSHRAVRPLTSSWAKGVGAGSRWSSRVVRARRAGARS